MDRLPCNEVGCRWQDIKGCCTLSGKKLAERCPKPTKTTTPNNPKVQTYWFETLWKKKKW